MQLARTFPRGHLVVWALVIALSLLSTMTSTVEGRTNPAPDSAPTIDAVGPVGNGPVFCTAWRTHRATTHYFSGNTGFPHVYVDWQVRYNGCDVIKDFVTCSAATTLVSVQFTWCGFYQSAAWNKDLIHVGANWNECTSPIGGVGACYSNYVRQYVRKDGYMRNRLYYQNEPASGSTWTWSSPY